MTLTRFDITQTTVDSMASTGNPATIKAAKCLQSLVDRHANSEYNRAKDLQDIDNARFFLPLDTYWDLVYSETGATPAGWVAG